MSSSRPPDDVTLDAAEEESSRLRTELENLRELLSCVEDELWMSDLVNQKVRPSRRWQEILGYEEGELASGLDAWFRLCHPEDVSQVERAIREHVQGTTPHARIEYRVRRKDGGWAWILSRVKVVASDAQGHPVRMVGTITDLTTTKANEERLRALLQAIPDLIFRLRADGTCLDFSSSSGEPTLLKPEDFIGRRIQELPVPKGVVDVTVTSLAQVLHEGGVAISEYEMDMPQGRQAYEARTVRSGADEAVCIIRNVTERKLMEERQAQLVKAEKLASLGQLAAGIAHEVNNPISYVMSNLKTLERYALGLEPLLGALGELLAPPGEGPRVVSAEQLARLREHWRVAGVDALRAETPELLQESLTGTRRIKEIVQSLRSFAREDGGKPQSVNLNEELESTLRMVGTELKYRCEVKRDFGPLPPLMGYPTQLVQVFTNLLVNAAQSMESFGEIRIRTRQQGRQVVVAISDTGKGMSQETLSRLFTPFFTTKPRGQGTGLGLSISHDIITRHGGRIEVQSELGRGTTFTIYLPLTPPA